MKKTIEMTSRRCLSGRVDPAKKHMYTTSHVLQHSVNSNIGRPSTRIFFYGANPLWVNFLLMAPSIAFIRLLAFNITVEYARELHSSFSPTLILQTGQP